MNEAETQVHHFVPPIIWSHFFENGWILMISQILDSSRASKCLMFFPPTILIAMFEIIYIENPFRTHYFYLRPIVVPELRMDTLHNPEAKLRFSVVFRAACGGLSKYKATFDNVGNQKHVEEIPRALSARYTCKMEHVDLIPAWTLLNFCGIE